LKNIFVRLDHRLRVDLPSLLALLIARAQPKFNYIREYISASFFVLICVVYMLLSFINKYLYKGCIAGQKITLHPSIVIMAPTYIISETKRYIGRNSKIVIFFHTPLHSTPQLGGFPSEYCHPVWHGKLEWLGYLKVKKFEDMFSGVDRIPACDRQTDGQTYILRRHSPR